MQEASAAQASDSAEATALPEGSSTVWRSRVPATGVPSGRSTSEVTFTFQDSPRFSVEMYTPSFPKRVSGDSHSQTLR